MKTIRLAWNHICILHPFEKKHLLQAKEKLKTQGINLEITFFGLGYPHHLSFYLAQSKSIDFDMIVSADTEVFQDQKIYQRLQLLHINHMIKTKSTVQITSLDTNCIPIVSIPLVYFGTCPNMEQFELTSFKEKIAVGGINNSAAKTIIKLLWQTYGKDAVIDFTKYIQFEQMPINAFYQCQTGNISHAIVPSIYAKRADTKTSFMSNFNRGPILLTSACCAINHIDPLDFLTVFQTIFDQELMNYYVQNGNLISHLSTGTIENPYEFQPCWQLDQHFLKTLSSSDFGNLYQKICPQATQPQYSNTL